MSVLIEAISVVMRIEAIERYYPGGLAALEEAPPNGTLCYDNSIARVGFMTPFDTKNFVERLEKMGFKHLIGDSAKDLVTVDQREGLLTRCDWLEVIFFDIDDDPEQRVVAAHLDRTRQSRRNGRKHSPCREARRSSGPPRTQRSSSNQHIPGDRTCRLSNYCG